MEVSVLGREAVAVAAALLEGGAFDDLVDDFTDVATGLFGIGDDFVDDGDVVVFGAAAEGVGIEFFREAAVEVGAAIAGGEDIGEFEDVIKFFAGHELSRGIDGRAVIFVAPATADVEILEGESEGVEAFVAGRAESFAGVEGEEFAFGGAVAGFFFCFFELRDIGWRGWGGCAEDIVEDIEAPFDGRGFGGIGGDDMEGGVGEKSFAFVLWIDFHEAHFRAFDAGDFIPVGELFVEEGVVGIKEFVGGAVFLEEVSDEHFGFPAHGAAEVLAKDAEGFAEVSFAGEAAGVDIDGLDVSGEKPLADEVIDDAFGFWIDEHAIDLGAQIGAEFIFASEAEEFVIGHGAPEEIREAGGEGELVDGNDFTGVVGLGLGFGAEEEARGSEDRDVSLGDAVFESAVGLGVDGLGDGDEFFEGFVVDGATVRAVGEVTDEFAGVFFAGSRVVFRRAVGEDGVVLIGVDAMRTIEGAAEVDGINVEVEVFFVFLRGFGFFERDGEIVAAFLEANFTADDDGFVEVPTEFATEDGFIVFEEGEIGAVAGGFGGALDLDFCADFVFAGVFDLFGVGEAVGFFEGDIAGLAFVFVSEIGAPHFDGGDVGAFSVDRFGDDFAGGVQVFLHEERREGEDIADVIEAVSGIVGGKGVGGVEVDAGEVSDSVLVFGAVEAPDGDATGIGVIGIDLEDLALDPAGDFFALLF